MPGPVPAIPGPQDPAVATGATQPQPQTGPLIRPSVEPSRATQKYVDLAIFALLLIVMLVYFEPGMIFSKTTTTGGDTAAHIYAPYFLKHSLLPKGLVSGWSPGWFAGFPMLHFYFPLVATFQAVLSYLIPYEIAFKLGTILGTFFMPVSVYIFLRLLRLRFPAPIVGAAVFMGFLFMDSFTIYGGNIASSLAGEYSFSFSLGLCFVFYGLAYRVATEDEGRPLLAGGVLAMAVLSHLVPVMMVALTSPVLVFLAWRKHGPKKMLKKLGVVFGLGFCLCAFWAIPFLARIGYTANMRWQSVTGITNIFPKELIVIAVGAGLGLIVGAWKRDWRILLLVTPAIWSLLLYKYLPSGHVWNGRFIPFWYLSVYLCCAYFVGNAISFIAHRFPRRQIAAATVGLAFVLAAASGGWILWDKKSNFVDQWISYNYGGYEDKPGFATFQKLTAAFDQLPPGRVMWEPNSSLGSFGSPIALMSLPYWTEQNSMEGMYFESSFTTPFHFLMASEVAEAPSNPISGLPYSFFDLQRGTDHMEMFDITYFVAVTDSVREGAEARPDLEPLAQVDEFTIYKVDSPGQVVVPNFEPVRLEGEDWIEANVKWFTDPTALDVPLVRGGDEDWASVKTTAEPLPRTPLEHAGASYDAVIEDDSISFTTDAIGEPHWIKTSYFPNWHVEGAEGPYLASPSMMMVVPTQAEVRLSYERTWAEWLGLFLTVGAATGLIVPKLRRRLVGFVQG